MIKNYINKIRQNKSVYQKSLVSVFKSGFTIKNKLLNWCEFRKYKRLTVLSITNDIQSLIVYDYCVIQKTYNIDKKNNKEQFCGENKTKVQMKIIS